MGSITFTNNLEKEVRNFLKDNEKITTILIVGETFDTISDLSKNGLTILKLPSMNNLPTSLDLYNALILINHGNLNQLEQELARCVPLIGANIICLNSNKSPPNSLFLISIPKSGTHLLTNLVSELGYSQGSIEDTHSSDTWKNLISSNTHTTAKSFFVDYVHNTTHGGRLHPFLNSCAIFIYRNPLDILVSEAKYYPKPDNTLFYQYFDGMQFEETLLDLVDNPFLGTIRDRTLDFSPWLKFSNVIPISYEELIPVTRGGKPNSQSKTIWSLMLKLKRSGRVKEIIENINSNSPSSATFSQGLSGSYQAVINQKVHQRLSKLPMDFMTKYGYDRLWTKDFNDFKNYKDKNYFKSKNVEFYRGKRLKLFESNNNSTPVLIKVIEDYNIVLYNQHYWGVQHGTEINFSELNPGNFFLCDVNMDKLLFKLFRHIENSS